MKLEVVSITWPNPTKFGYSGLVAFANALDVDYRDIISICFRINTENEIGTGIGRYFTEYANAGIHVAFGTKFTYLTGVMRKFIDLPFDDEFTSQIKLIIETRMNYG